MNWLGASAGMCTTYCVKCLSRPTTQACVTNTYVLQAIDTAPFYGRSANNQWSLHRYQAHHISYSYRLSYICTVEVFSRPPSDEHFIFRSWCTNRRKPVSYNCDDASRTSPRAGRRVGPPAVPFDDVQRLCQSYHPHIYAKRVSRI